MIQPAFCVFSSPEVQRAVCICKIEKLRDFCIEDGYHSEPVKVMDNVQTVSLGNSYMGDVYVGGALTKDGSLYMCGDRYSGQ